MKTLTEIAEKFDLLSEVEMNQVKGGTAKEKDIYDPDEK